MKYSQDYIESRQDIPPWMAWPTMCAGLIALGLSFWLHSILLFFISAPLIGAGCAGISMRRIIRNIYADRPDNSP